MDPEPDDYAVEIIPDEREAPSGEDAETEAIEEEGDPVGDNFA